jgi:hypothetical protein
MMYDPEQGRMVINPLHTQAGTISKAWATVTGMPGGLSQRINAAERGIAGFKAGSGITGRISGAYKGIYPRRKGRIGEGTSGEGT